MTLAIYPTHNAASTAVAYGGTSDSHAPSGDATWVYDRTESAMAKELMWHQRAAFSNGAFHRHPGNVHAYFSGKHIIGDCRTATSMRSI